jgi:histidine triad (HIT) family protein
MDCVFCGIRDGKIPCFKIYEDDKTLAFMDINPLNDGHCLVIAKNHAENLYEIPEEDLARVMQTVKKLALALRVVLKPEGLNLFQANGKAAFQSVFHFHIHLVPRWENDGVDLDWELKKGDFDHIKAVAEKIKGAVG